ncbi:hypothetical protein GDO81_025460 [Engystomops pustulosus]|uniref:Zinc transporter ZIP11 n=1 Tax=Engystomops pustulosus TaxID=76066 RepID=A0AAV6ZM55_ENGPU|nr:hypothetical protein GDO81_025460 [Engystomops pustulosus]
MIEGYSPVIQSLLGTLFTWGLTAAGSALVFVFSTGQRRILDGSLGFAAGVMLAASYWSLLAPAIEMSSQYGSWAFLPAAIGFSFGAGFVYFADMLLPALGVNDDPFSIATSTYESKPVKEKDEGLSYEERELSIRIGRGVSHTGKHPLSSYTMQDCCGAVSFLNVARLHQSLRVRRVSLLISVFLLVGHVTSGQ